MLHLLLPEQQPYPYFIGMRKTVVTLGLNSLKGQSRLTPFGLIIFSHELNPVAFAYASCLYWIWWVMFKYLAAFLKNETGKC
jgi:hypothetical protein